jgi:mannose-6-phosphate isomerase-like protein (cupin superfamily)
MPVIAGPNADQPTDEFTYWGLAEFKKGQMNPVELHFHDCDEFFIIIHGRMRVRTEGREYVVGPGDVVATRMGDEHEIIEVLEDTRYFWFEAQLRGKKRHGHLHRGKDEP